MEKRYSISDALNMVLLPDGNISDFDDDDESDNESLPCEPEEYEVDDDGIIMGGLVAEIDQREEVPDDNKAIDDRATSQPKVAKTSKKYKWTKDIVNPPHMTSDFVFSDPPDDIATPYEYFKMFVTQDLVTHISEQTNLYAMQTDGKQLGITPSDIEQYIGILLFTGIYPCPSYRMYWQNVSRFPAIADVMPRNTFENLLRYSHYNNNATAKPRDHPEYDPLFKVQPLVSSLRDQLKTIEQEERQCIDEQMIPFKGRSKFKQYLKKKPKKWGFKVFTRSGVSGIMYDFEIYTGKKTNLPGDYGVSGNSVVRMLQNLPAEREFKV